MTIKVKKGSWIDRLRKAHHLNHPLSGTKGGKPIHTTTTLAQQHASVHHGSGAGAVAVVHPNPSGSKGHAITGVVAHGAGGAPAVRVAAKPSVVGTNARGEKHLYGPGGIRSK